MTIKTLTRRADIPLNSKPRCIKCHKYIADCKGHFVKCPISTCHNSSIENLDLHLLIAHKARMEKRKLILL